MGFMEKQALTSHLLRHQNGLCPGCGERIIHAVLDHDHHTDLVRGALCGPCNSAEGRAGDDHPFWSAYRIDNPASQLGIKRYYRNL